MSECCSLTQENKKNIQKIIDIKVKAVLVVKRGIYECVYVK